jgi:NAD(P)-dependent dehydrogenase (short-subunit alcohol dehydrogenase family)
METMSAIRGGKRNVGSGKVAVVTGGASGIGLGVCELFAQSGYRVAMLDLQEEALEREGTRLRELGGSVLPCRADVSKRSEIDATYAQVREQFGPISIVIAAAGVAPFEPFTAISAESWQRSLDINLTGVFHTIQAAVPDMIEHEWGRIITISSQAGQGGAPGMAHYAAAKAGVIGLTKALARELGRYRITVNTIPPAIVDTPMMRGSQETGELPGLRKILPHLPIQRAGLPSDIAYACEFLASDKAEYITGQQIAPNGGYSM